MTDIDKLDIDSRNSSSKANISESGSNSSKEGKRARTDSLNYDSTVIEERAAAGSGKSKSNSITAFRLRQIQSLLS